MEIIGNSEQFSNWAKHFNAVKALIIQPKKTHSVSVKMKNGQRYNYKYADLAGVDKAIQQAVNQVRDKDGLPCLNYSVDAGIDIDGIWAETLVIDSSGCAVKLSKLWFKSANVGNAQSSASLLSYAKRYSLSASFGIASEDDDDAQQFVNNQPEQPEQPQAHYLNDSELNSYMVVYAGRRLKLADLMQDAIDGDKDVQNWIKSERDPQTVIAIKQLSDIYKRSAKKVEPKPEPVEQKTEDKTIKELVDGHEPENPENLFDGLE